MSKPPVRLDTFAEKARAWYHALISQHNLVNIVWLNLHPVAEGKIYRSAQPTPWQLEKLIREYGFKSVINLRGEKPHRPVYALEKRVCDEKGVPLIDVSIFSRRIPDDTTLKALKKAFEKASFPVLMHCKAGADRSSLASVLYLHWVEKMPIEEAMRKHLRFWPYGYIKSSGAGIIAAYFEAFVDYEKEHPGADIIEWSKRWADRERRKAFEKRFKENRTSFVADFFFEKILRRE
ncbi:fused DSP-PTPase phosphatase/NAD kinase-like protein [Hydrogenimonas urashimensis]|uniref:fused DSP-PTPase phosphatase/NAD kinase-like protein n=1 Tax=Hydrogenimonas urashimensis TaxID=2740515 RepID=UPI0019153AF2|nr:sulfur transferase domain-containing protein [Hydrogenimonas urashimensis]